MSTNKNCGVPGHPDDFVASCRYCWAESYCICMRAELDADGNCPECEAEFVCNGCHVRRPKTEKRYNDDDDEKGICDTCVPYDAPAAPAVPTKRDE